MALLKAPGRPHVGTPRPDAGRQGDRREQQEGVAGSADRGEGGQRPRLIFRVLGQRRPGGKRQLASVEPVFVVGDDLEVRDPQALPSMPCQTISVSSSSLRGDREST